MKNLLKYPDQNRSELLFWIGVIFLLLGPIMNILSIYMPLTIEQFFKYIIYVFDILFFLMSPFVIPGILKALKAGVWDKFTAQ